METIVPICSLEPNISFDCQSFIRTHFRNSVIFDKPVLNNVCVKPFKKPDLKKLRSDLWVKSEMIIIRHGRINQRSSKLSGPFLRKKFDIDWKLGLLV